MNENDKKRICGLATKELGKLKRKKVLTSEEFEKAIFLQALINEICIPKPIEQKSDIERKLEARSKEVEKIKELRKKVFN